jgi:hypothetical protein
MNARKHDEIRSNGHILFDTAVSLLKQDKLFFSSHLSTSCLHPWKMGKGLLTHLCLRGRETLHAIPKQGFLRGTISPGNEITAIFLTFWKGKYKYVNSLVHRNIGCLWNLTVMPSQAFFQRTLSNVMPRLHVWVSTTPPLPLFVMNHLKLIGKDLF